MVKESEKIEYSVVVPIYDEVGNIAILDREIKEVMDKVGNYEIIYVNDGSRDPSIVELRKLKGVKIISLNKNYGQATALDAGFKASVGGIVISLDGDLQNDPRDIPRLLAKMRDKDLDVVTGWRKNRRDKRGLCVLTKIGMILRKKMIGDMVHDTGCTLRVYKKSAVRSLDLQGEMHRYILALLKWKGFRIGELEVNHRPRIHGKTKYGYDKAVRGFIDLIYIWFIQKYSQRPLHMFGILGLLSFFVGFLALILSAYHRIFMGLGLNRSGWFFSGFFLFLGGIIFFSFGIIMDRLIKLQLTMSPHEKRYYVREVIDTL